MKKTLQELQIEALEKRISMLEGATKMSEIDNSIICIVCGGTGEVVKSSTYKTNFKCDICTNGLLNKTIKTEPTPLIEHTVVEYSTKLEVSPCLGEMNWEDAKRACEALGEGWRLPTIIELSILYSQKSKDDKTYYWSSTEYNATFAFFFSFLDGYANYFRKGNTLSVRRVRDI